MIFKRKISLLLVLVSFDLIVAKEYNLFGIVGGQAYAVEVNLGHPRQKLSVLVDTGSSSLVVASKPGPEINRYFKAEDSNSLYDSGSVVKATYTESEIYARLVTDYIQFPSLPLAGEVSSDIALITSSRNFFINGSGWQGILGLAYSELAAVAHQRESSAQPWLDAVDRELGKTLSFSLELCGVRSATNATLHGSFSLLDDTTSNENTNKTYRTPILREGWYEIGILSVRVSTTSREASEKLVATKRADSVDLKNKSSIEDMEPSQNTCRKLNEVNSILDSGTTSIRLPEDVFRKVVGELLNAARSANIVILDEFWYHGKPACWPEPREWDLPWLAIDLLSENDHQYFTIELPPKSYIRLEWANSGNGTGLELCYRLGIESSNNTVLGVVALEGLQVLFNKQEGYIGFQTSHCGPDVRITGPHDTNVSLHDLCKFPSRPRRITRVETIRVAQWIVAVTLTVAMTLLVYLLAPCVRARCVRTLTRTHTQISLSRAALVDEATQ